MEHVGRAKRNQSAETETRETLSLRVERDERRLGRSLVARAAHDDEGFARNVIPVGAALGAPVGAGTAVLSSRVMAASAVLAAAMLVKAARLTSSPAPERSRSWG